MTTSGASAVDPARWLDGASLERSAVLFVIGLGDGRLLRVLAGRGWRGTVVALEPSGTSPLTSSPGCHVLCGPDYQGLDDIVRALEPDCEQPVVVGDPALMQTRRDEAVRASRLVVKAWFGARANQEARRKYAGPYLLNTLRNLSTIAAEGDAATLVDLFRGRPAVLVAAGPSLDQNLPAIAAHRDRVVLVAVDTALRPLLAAGLAPDLVVALDPSDANASHLVDLPPCPRTWLVAEGSLDPEAFGHFAGRTHVFRVADHHPWPWLRQVGEGRHLLRAWGSVLTTAFDLALQMGCDPIVFTGADLAFTGGRPYARGTTFEEEWRRARAWGDSLETSWAQRLAAWPDTFEADVHGRRARTSPHLIAFRDWIVTEAARVPARRIVNATGAGILVGGSIHQATLDSALAGSGALAEPAAETLARAQRPRATRAAARPDVPADVRAAWQVFAGVSDAAIDEALGTTGTADVPPGPEAPIERAPADADDHDARFLADLARTTSVRRLTLHSADQDLLGELRDLAQHLGPDDAVVIDDRAGVSAGAQVRQAMDVLLCEQPDIRVDYRRFVDVHSRLTVIRAGALACAPPPEAADAAKWDAAHAAVADRIVPLLARQFAPRSVVDLGCGAGFWLQAFETGGVTDVHGVNARTTPLGAVPDAGRRFDLCLCLEVVHRLAPADQDALVAACTRASDVVVFSSQLPGAAGGTGLERPLQHWARLFWRHGYVLDDTLRPILERHGDIPGSVFEVLVTFRRAWTVTAGDGDGGAMAALEAPVLALAARLNDLYTQKLWWAVAALGHAQAAVHIETPQVDLHAWPLPAARLQTAADGSRVFRFRTEAARWYVTHQRVTLRVFEDGRPLPEVPGPDVPAGAGGGWARWRDEIRLRARDGSDPRVNRRQYTVLLPSHVAWAETQALAEVLRHDL